MAVSVLDPIVSLAVAIAEGPGSFAFFLGSGISRDAGVPTGAAVLAEARGELYRLENATENMPDQDGLAEWLQRTGRSDLGYSGSDEAIAKAMRARNSRYGFYWVSRGKPAAPASAVVEATSGRVIKRPGAAEFLRDLERRLAVFRAHPSGDTPLSVHDEVMLLIRRGDQVGLAEIMRRERQELLNIVRGYVEKQKNANPTADLMTEAYTALRPCIDRRLGSLLPVIAYRTDDFGDEVAHLVHLDERKPLAGGYGFWDQLNEWVVWYLGYALGSFAIRLGRTSAMRSLFAARVCNRYGSTTEPLMDYTPREGGWKMATEVLKTRSGGSWLSPAWELLTEDLASTEVLQERWQEFVTDGDPLRSLQDFDFLLERLLGHQRGLLTRSLADVPRWCNGVRPATARRRVSPRRRRPCNRRPAGRFP